MSTTKKASKNNMDDMQAALQALIAQGKKDGMIRATDLNAVLEKMQLTPEKIEEIYDRFDAMNIQIITADLELDLGDDGDLVDDGDIDLSGLDEEDLVDPVDLAAEYSLDDPVRMYLKEIGNACVNIMAETPLMFVPDCPVPFVADAEIGYKWGEMYKLNMETGLPKPKE